MSTLEDFSQISCPDESSTSLDFSVLEMVVTRGNSPTRAVIQTCMGLKLKHRTGNELFRLLFSPKSNGINSLQPTADLRFIHSTKILSNIRLSRSSTLDKGVVFKTPEMH